MKHAELIIGGDPAVLERTLRAPLAIRPDNLVARPWGGKRLAEYKGLPAGAVDGGQRYGESFECAAHRGDGEAAAHPSLVEFADGSSLPLIELIDRAPAAVLGEPLAPLRCLPLLPKFLDVEELLSVQAHPPGNPEAYFIIDADPGATLHVGFAQDVDAALFAERCRQGREAQQALAGCLAPGIDEGALQEALAPLLSGPDSAADDLQRAASGLLDAPAQRSLPLFATLLETYREVLGALNAIEVRPGSLVWNATPERLRNGAPVSAEVHALGNTLRRRVLMLEVRKPGVTYRAWDHVRFPRRELAIDAALAALNTTATTGEEFLVTPPANGEVAVQCEDFSAWRYQLAPGASVRCPLPAVPATVHVIRGALQVDAMGGEAPLSRGAGSSAVVPAGCAEVCLTADSDAECVLVTVGNQR